MNRERERELWESFFESDRWRREKIFSFFFSLSEGHVNHVSPYFYFKLISAENKSHTRKRKKSKTRKAHAREQKSYYWYYYFSYSYYVPSSSDDHVTRIVFFTPFAFHVPHGRQRRSKNDSHDDIVPPLFLRRHAFKTFLLETEKRLLS